MRAVIAGAGIIGLACAWELVRRGIRVVIVDPREPGSGCSRGNAGWVTPTLAGPLPHPDVRSSALRLLLDPEGPLFIEPRAVPALASWLWSFWRHCNRSAYAAGLQATGRLGRGTHDLFDRWVDDGVDFEMHRSGLLFLLRDADHADAYLADLDALTGMGYPAPEPLDAKETRELEPAVAEGVRAGVWVPDERHVRPDTLCDGLAARLTERGAAFRLGATVTGVKRKGDTITAFTVRDREGRRRVEGDLFLIAAGAWSGQVAAKCGVRLPIQAAKGYSLTVEAPTLDLRRPLYLVDAKIGVSPFDGAHRMAGTLELSGVNDRLDRRRLAALVEATEAYLPGIARGGTMREWVGMRPLTPDGLPVLGRLPVAENLYIASGHALLGITLAPTSARSLADLMTGLPALDLRPFDPRRFDAGNDRGTLEEGLAQVRSRWDGLKRALRASSHMD